MRSCDTCRYHQYRTHMDAHVGTYSYCGATKNRPKKGYYDGKSGPSIGNKCIGYRQRRI